MKRQLLVLCSCLAMAGVLLAGCGGGGGAAVNKVADTTTIQPSGNGVVTSDVTMKSADATVSIPSGTQLQDSDGNPVTGTVSAHVSVASSTSALTHAAQTLPDSLTSTAAAVVSIDLASTSATVAYLSQPITVNVKVPNTKAGDLVLVYSFNGLSWVAEGSATVKPDGSVDMSIMHFSDWLASKPKTLDTVPPTVKMSSPSGTEIDVAPNREVYAVFSEAMDQSTLLKNGTFTLKDSSNKSVNGNVRYDSSTFAAIFKPTKDLDASTVYTATITTAAQDLYGNAMQSAASWRFTTAAQPDTKAPYVVSTTPANGATGVSITAPLVIKFSEPLDPVSVKSNLINSIPGTVLYDPTTNTAKFTPLSPLQYGTTYTFTIRPTVKDLAGNTSTSFTVQFTTQLTGSSGGSGF